MKWLKRTEPLVYQIVLPHPLTRAPIHGAFLPLKKKKSKSKSKNQKEKRKPKKRKRKRKAKEKRSVKTEAQFTVSALRGSGLPSLLHLKTEDQFPISAFRLRFTFPSILETEAYWLAVTAFKGSGSSPFSATFQRWTKKKKRYLRYLLISFTAVLTAAIMCQVLKYLVLFPFICLLFD